VHLSRRVHGAPIGRALAQEARKIVGAQLQAITYKEWLPKVLGGQFGRLVGDYRNYNSSVDPTIADYFTFAAMRFGHGMIQESYSRLDEALRQIPEGGLRFDEGILKPSKLLFEGGMDPVLRGLMSMAVKRPQRLTTSLTEKMFGSTDLAALNIQRGACWRSARARSCSQPVSGRDAGLASYNEYREFCGLKRAASFDDLAAEITDKVVRENLRQGYQHVGEPHAASLNAQTDSRRLQTTWTCTSAPSWRTRWWTAWWDRRSPAWWLTSSSAFGTATGQHDQAFRFASDSSKFYRFWYQNPGIFSTSQLAELEKASLARIICDDSDNFKQVTRDAFELMTNGSLVTCDVLPSIDLEKWLD